MFSGVIGGNTKRSHKYTYNTHSHNDETVGLPKSLQTAFYPCNDKKMDFSSKTYCGANDPIGSSPPPVPSLI